MQRMLFVKFCSGNECNVDLGSCLTEVISMEVVLAVITQCHIEFHAASAGVMAFHAASPPSAEINMRDQHDSGRPNPHFGTAGL